jgi:phage/plasmid-associated DNA primase
MLMILLKRRIILIPFQAEFRDINNYNKENPKHRLGNKNIENELLEKLDELLVWLVNGSIKYFKEGIGNTPDLIIKATNDYMKENDDLGNFINEYCERKENGFVYHSEIYSLYKQIYNVNISDKQFTNMLKNFGIELGKKKDGRGFKHIIIKNNINDHETSDL